MKPYLLALVEWTPIIYTLKPLGMGPFIKTLTGQNQPPKIQLQKNGVLCHIVTLYHLYFNFTLIVVFVAKGDVNSNFRYV